MSDLHHAIGAHGTLIYAITLPVLAGAAGYLVWKLGFAPAKAPGDLPDSVELGQSRHSELGQAKTAKIESSSSRAATVPMNLASPTATASSSAAASASQPAHKAAPRAAGPDARQKVERMGEIGFHQSVEKRPTPLPGQVRAAPTALVPAAAPAYPPLSAAPAPVPAPPAPKPPVDDSPELDDILSRIDKVLSDNPVMATSTIASGSAAAIGKSDTTRIIEHRPSDAQAPTDPILAKPVDAGIAQAVQPAGNEGKTIPFPGLAPRGDESQDRLF